MFANKLLVYIRLYYCFSIPKRSQKGERASVLWHAKCIALPWHFITECSVWLPTRVCDNGHHISRGLLRCCTGEGCWLRNVTVVSSIVCANMHFLFGGIDKITLKSLFRKTNCKRAAVTVRLTVSYNTMYTSWKNKNIFWQNMHNYSTDLYLYAPEALNQNSGEILYTKAEREIRLPTSRCMKK